MTVTYSDRFRLNKPDFRTSPWSSLVNENTDKLDEILYNILQAAAIGPYENDAAVEAGQILYDTALGSLWICSVSHTTKATGTFADERAENPDDWTQLNLGIEIKGQWANDTFYAVNAMAYDATEGLTGICTDEHTSGSTGSMRDEIDKWDIIFDSQGGGGIAANTVSYDDTAQAFTAANVQDAIDETNTRIDTEAELVSTLETSVDDLSTDMINAQNDIDALKNFATAADIYSKAIGKSITPEKLWDAAVPVDLGNVTGTVTLNFNNGLNFKMTLTGNITIANPDNLKLGQAFGLYFVQDGTGGRTVSFGTQWCPIGLVAPIIGASANQKSYVSGQKVDTSIIAYSGGKITT